MMGDNLNLTGPEVMKELIAFFGPYRGLQLIGWATYWAAWCGHDDPQVTEEWLKASKLSRAASFRALADFKRFGEHLRKYGPVLSRSDLVRLIAGVGFVA